MKIFSTLQTRITTWLSYMLLFVFCTNTDLFGQVLKTFAPRTSSQALSQYAGQSIFHLRGDFTMIGNTNVTLSNYNENGNASSNNNPMKFVDIDGVNSTINSSSAKLKLSSGTGVDENCSKVVFAGLYWSGRAAREVSKGNELKYIESELSISTGGNGNSNRYLIYKLGNSNVFKFYNQGSSPKVLFNDVEIPVTFNTFQSNNDDYIKATFNTPVVVYDVATKAKIVVHSLTRRTSNGSQSIESNAVALIETIPYSNSVLLDKSKVKFKIPGSNNYAPINAQTNSIYYSKQEAGYMYAGFADVTALVRDNANNVNGEYSVADIAAGIGDADGTGYYGGWGLVVVYENTKMPWRDVTMFDGLAYVVGNTTTSHEMQVSGFKAVQNTGTNQEIKVKMGMMAGEGDRNISGDYFQIRNSANNGWKTLNHANNSSDNFFNSSITTDINTRNQGLNNNTGIDIAMFDLPNADRSIIDYGQTSTKFKYGSTQDTYIIYNIIFAVDAYIPEIEGLSRLVKVNENNITGSGNQTINAGDYLTYEVEVRNRGTEALTNAVLEVPMPYLASYVSSSAQWIYAGTPGGTYANPTFDPTLGANGKILWKIGNMPLPANGSDVIGKLTFKIKATDDCRRLNVLNCVPKISLNGKVSGVGKLSGVSVENSFITGYQEGSCAGNVIRDPQIITITTTCSEPSAEQVFTFCNLTTPTINFWDIANSFDEGTRFYTMDGTVEISSQDGFPNNNANYVAIPRGGEFGDGNCYYNFSLVIGIITETPDLLDNGEITYCINAVASPLSATTSNSNYNLFYYYANDLQTAYSQIVPSTINAGTTTYYVAQGTSNCIGPKAQINVEVGTCNLPVTLVSLNAEEGDQGVIVNWITTEEVNSAFFDVERSMDPRDGFVKVGTVTAKGVYAGGKYGFQDATAEQGAVNYYRLKMVDLDKSYTYSPIINVKLSGEVDTKIYPNPVVDEMIVSSNTPIAKIEMINLSGQTVSVNVFGGNKTKETIKVSSLYPGTYLVRISTTSGTTYFKKLVKRN